jgi:hypothetical protein
VLTIYGYDFINRYNKYQTWLYIARFLGLTVFMFVQGVPHGGFQTGTSVATPPGGSCSPEVTRRIAIRIFDVTSRDAARRLTLKRRTCLMASRHDAYTVTPDGYPLDYARSAPGRAHAATPDLAESLTAPEPLAAVRDVLHAIRQGREADR